MVLFMTIFGFWALRSEKKEKEREAGHHSAQ
jgi:hypothetical protein